MTIDPSDPLFSATKRVWDRYKELTRFLHSSRIAMDREAALWTTLELREPDAVKVSAPTFGGSGAYTVAVTEHIAALNDNETLSGLVLLGCCSLSEELTRIRLGVDELERAGVSTWGNAALRLNGRSLSDLGDEHAVLIEAYAARNLFVHGYSTWSQKGVNRLSDVGGAHPSVGAPLEVAERLEAYRHAIKRYMRLTGMTVD